MQREPEESVRDPTESKELTPAQQTEFARKIDTMTEAVTEDPQSCLRFLDVLADNPDYGVNDTLLALSQNPDATLIHSREEWERMGRRVRRDAQGMQVRVQGIIGLGVERRRGWLLGVVYDASQTYGRKLVPRPALAPDSPETAELFRTFCAASPFGVHIFPEMEQDAVYGGWGHGISVSADLPPDKAFAALARETHHGLETIGYSYRIYDRKDGELDADCVSYMLCRSMGIPCAVPDVSGIASRYAGVALKERRTNLKAMRDNFTIMRDRILEALPPKEIVQNGRKKASGQRKREAVR
ncbi:MAG: hypothetical protein IJT94_17610 [Oscillibacter sp.]|nr:hypothetical protein [Oscillibacter sp.]